MLCLRTCPSVLLLLTLALSATVTSVSISTNTARPILSDSESFLVQNWNEGKGQAWPGGVHRNLTWCLAFHSFEPFNVTLIPQESTTTTKDVILEAVQMAMEVWERSADVRFPYRNIPCSVGADVWFRVVVGLRGLDRDVMAFASILHLFREWLDGTHGPPMAIPSKPWAIRKSGGKVGQVGLAARSQSTVTLSKELVRLGFIPLRDTVIHEIGHVLGFYHEHLISGLNAEGATANCEDGELPNLVSALRGADSGNKWSYDPRSVMNYDFCGGQQSHFYQLSDIDAHSVAGVYGPPTTAVPSQQLTRHTVQISDSPGAPLEPLEDVIFKSNMGTHMVPIRLERAKGYERHFVHIAANIQLSRLLPSSSDSVNFLMTKFERLHMFSVAPLLGKMIKICGLFGTTPLAQDIPADALPLADAIREYYDILDRIGFEYGQAVVRQICSCPAPVCAGCHAGQISMGLFQGGPHIKTKNTALENLLVIRCSDVYQEAVARVFFSHSGRELVGRGGSYNMQLVSDHFSDSVRTLYIVLAADQVLYQRPELRSPDTVVLEVVTRNGSDVNAVTASQAGFALNLLDKQYSAAQIQAAIRSFPLAESESLSVLDLSGNNVDVLLPVETKSRVRGVREIRAQNSGVRSLNPQLCSLFPSLKVLVVSGNSISGVGDMRSCKNLVSLDLSANNITSVDESSLPPQIQVLILQSNPFSELSAIRNLENLVELDVAHSAVSSIPSLPPSLRKIDITSTALSRIPPLPPGLVTLDASNVAFDDTFGAWAFKGLNKLTWVDLSACSLSSFPSSLLETSSLRILNLNHNRIRHISIAAGRLPSLESLRLAGNGMESFELEGTDGNNLKILDVSENRLKSLKLGKTPKHLNLQSNMLTEQDLPSFHNVEYLDISDNAIAGPLVLANITSLKQLVAANNSISAIFPEKLCVLIHIDVSRNQIQSAASLLEACDHLTFGNFSHNLLSTFEFNNIHTLDASWNQLVDVHLSPWATTALLTHNNLTYLPLESAPGLEVLDMSYNNVREIDLGAYSSSFFSLISINLRGNGLRALQHPNEDNDIALDEKMFLDQVSLVTSHIDFRDNNITDAIVFNGFVSQWWSGCETALLKDSGLPHPFDRNYRREGDFQQMLSTGGINKLSVASKPGVGIPPLVWRFRGLEQLKADLVETLPSSKPDQLNATHLSHIVLRGTFSKLPGWILELPALKHLVLESPNLQVVESPSHKSTLEHLAIIGGVLSSVKLLNVSLVTLRISQSGLWYLPNSVGGMHRLRRLDVSRNRLLELPRPIGSLPNLTELFVSLNYLVSLPPLANPSLKYLIAASNRLNSVFDMKLPSLERLVLKDNPELTSLPTFVNTPNLKRLWVWGCSLSEFPHGLANATHLTHVNVAYNSIQRLPDLPSLSNSTRDLGLGHNQLEVLPDWVGELPLWSLSVFQNKLRTLPAGLFTSPHLVELLASDNQLERLPDTVSPNSRIAQINLSHNRLKSLPEGLFHDGFPIRFSGAHNHLESVPTGIGHAFDITLRAKLLESAQDPVESKAIKDLIKSRWKQQHLDLSHNHLSEVPMSVGRMKSLDLSNNRFTEFPIGLRGSNVRSLYLMQNNITHLPDWLKSVKRLSHLDISRTLISDLSNIGQARKLDALILDETPVAKLPRQMFGLKRLRSLSASRCQISEVDGIFQRGFRRIELSYNFLNDSHIGAFSRWLDDHGQNSIVRFNADNNFFSVLPCGDTCYFARAHISVCANNISSVSVRTMSDSYVRLVGNPITNADNTTIRALVHWCDKSTTPECYKVRRKLLHIRTITISTYRELWLFSSEVRVSFRVMRQNGDVEATGVQLQSVGSTTVNSRTKQMFRTMRVYVRGKPTFEFKDCAHGGTYSSEKSLFEDRTGDLCEGQLLEQLFDGEITHKTRSVSLRGAHVDCYGVSGGRMRELCVDSETRAPVRIYHGQFLVLDILYLNLYPLVFGTTRLRSRPFASLGGHARFEGTSGIDGSYYCMDEDFERALMLENCI